jgi:predicted nicotinamide N-methyase
MGNWSSELLCCNLLAVSRLDHAKIAMNTSPQSAGFFTETPLDAVANRVRETISIGDRTFILSRPASSERLMDHPAIHTAFAADEYMPYWADLWPGARMLAKAILREKRTPGLECLEVGCGLGLSGITALACGLRVTFSDYDATALHFAADNARANGFSDFRLLQLDWRFPPAGMQFPLILAADLIYESRNVEPLVALIKQMLAPGGICLATDQDRPPAKFFCETLSSAGFPYTSKVMYADEPAVRGTLYRITKPV